MKGIYLGAYTAIHPNYNIIYQDINNKRDISGDMKDIDLSNYDFIICTPPCNFWSRARGKRCSKYSLDTKHLLPYMINKLQNQEKPFIIENVLNDKRMKENRIFDIVKCNVYRVNRHIYFTNIKLDLTDIKQRQDFKYGGKVIMYDDMTNKSHQGGYNVHQVIERFLGGINNDRL